ncbi:hypothetical protein ES703_25939 [subsurface metagenome]
MVAIEGHRTFSFSQLSPVGEIVLLGMNVLLRLSASRSAALYYRWVRTSRSST